SALEACPIPPPSQTSIRIITPHSAVSSAIAVENEFSSRWGTFSATTAEEIIRVFSFPPENLNLSSSPSRNEIVPITDAPNGSVLPTDRSDNTCPLFFHPDKHPHASPDEVMVRLHVREIGSGGAIYLVPRLALRELAAMVPGAPLPAHMIRQPSFLC